MFMPLAAGAILSYNTSYTQDTNLHLSGSGIDLVILAGSKSNALTINSSTFQVVVPNGYSFTVRYPYSGLGSPGTLVNDGGLVDCHLVGINNEVTVTGSATVTFTPNLTTCVAPGSSGGSTTSVTVVQPNGGDALAGGGTFSIGWSVNGTAATSARLSYSTDSGVTWNVITSTTPNTGSYSWSVPNIYVTTARVRVEGLGTGGAVVATDDSDADFAIATTTGGGGGGGLPPSSGNSELALLSTSASGHGALSRTDANLHLPPSYPVDSLVRLADNPAVYYLGLDAKRHSFWNTATYMSWYANFDGVQVIDAATLASVPLGAPILPRPGSFWVKIQSDPKTYYVEPGNRLRWIKDEAAALQLGGPNWNQNIVDIDPTLFMNYVVDNPIDGASLTTDWPAGALVSDAAGITWYVTPSMARPFANDAAFQANHFQRKFVSSADGGWKLLSHGAVISGLEDQLFSLQH